MRQIAAFVALPGEDQQGGVIGPAANTRAEFPPDRPKESTVGTYHNFVRLTAHADKLIKFK